MNSTEIAVSTVSKSPLEKLQTQLDKDFTWRKKELTIAKANIDSSTGEALDFNLKVATMILYSHWEGFIKNSSRKYLDFLNKKKYTLSKLKNNFKVLHFTKNILEIAGTQKKSKYVELYEAFSKEHEDIFFVNSESNHIINTHGNLKYEALEEILYSLNFETTDFQTRDNFINLKLLSVRNKIAHGEYYSYIKHTSAEEKEEFAKKEFFQLYNEILHLMDIFKDMIIDAALKESYLAN